MPEERFSEDKKKEEGFSGEYLLFPHPRVQWEVVMLHRLFVSLRETCDAGLHKYI